MAGQAFKIKKPLKLSQTTRMHNKKLKTKGLKMNILETLNKAYQEAPQGSEGEMFTRAYKDFKFSNGQPLNILKAMIILKTVAPLVEVGVVEQVELDGLISHMEFITGYNQTEIRDRMGV